jgi:hypothetical protein
MRCRSCDTPVELAAGERVGFRDACDHCGADLHTCQHCAFHDPGAHNECREPSAERVSDRERANRCDHFSPGEGGAASDVRSGALAELDSLFKK